MKIKIKIQIGHKYKILFMIFSYLDNFGQLQSGKETTQSVKSLKFHLLGLYFTADWCSSCHRLAPQLKKVYDKICSVKPDYFKIITFRLDETDSTLGYSYWRFSSISLYHSENIASILKVRFLPSLLIYNLKGEIISRDGITDMMKYQEKVIQHWQQLNK